MEFIARVKGWNLPPASLQTDGEGQQPWSGVSGNRPQRTKAGIWSLVMLSEIRWDVKHFYRDGSKAQQRAHRLYMETQETRINKARAQLKLIILALFTHTKHMLLFTQRNITDELWIILHMWGTDVILLRTFLRLFCWGLTAPLSAFFVWTFGKFWKVVSVNDDRIYSYSWMRWISTEMREFVSLWWHGSARVLVGSHISGTNTPRLSCCQLKHSQTQRPIISDESGNGLSVKTNSCADVQMYGVLRVKTLFKSHLDLQRQYNHAHTMHFNVTHQKMWIKTLQLILLPYKSPHVPKQVLKGDL